MGDLQVNPHIEIYTVSDRDSNMNRVKVDPSASSYSRIGRDKFLDAQTAMFK